MSNDKLREAAGRLIDNWLAQEPGCTVAAISNDLGKLTAALADSADDPLPMTNDGRLYQHAIVFGSREEAEAAHEKLKAIPDTPPSTNSGEVVNELVVGVNEEMVRAGVCAVTADTFDYRLTFEDRMNAVRSILSEALAAAQKEG